MSYHKLSVYRSRLSNALYGGRGFTFSFQTTHLLLPTLCFHYNGHSHES